MELTIEQALVKDFTEAGFKPEVKKLAEFQDDYGLGAVDGEDDEDEEDDEDGEDDGSDDDEDDDDDE